MDFFREGQAVDLSDTQRMWPGGRGSFVVSGVATSVTLQARFNPTVGYQAITGDLTVATDGVVNFELPGGVALRVLAVGGDPTYCAARHITEVGST